MKSLILLMLFTLLLAHGAALGQQTPHDLLTVGPEGTVLQVRMPYGNALAPIVLLGDKVLSPGSVDCVLASGHPQCSALNYLLGTLGAAFPPDNVYPSGGQGDACVFIDFTVTHQPPPVVYLCGEVVNLTGVNAAIEHRLQVIGPAGEIVVVETGGAGSSAPFVLLNGEVLNASGMDCQQIGIGNWECQLPSGGELTWRDSESGPVGVYTGFEGNVFADFTVADSPPPAVYKDGNILNR